MKIFAPTYYKKFKCIADKCQHNCCIGWEIDIDGDTLDFYRSLNDEFGNKIINNVSFSNEPHFRLTSDDRCPFLSDRGLCDIISNLGEEALCQICTDHPRFKNYYDTRIEFGLGLCCEAATQLVLNDTEKFSLIAIGEDEGEAEDNETEAYLFKLRDALLNTEQSFEAIVKNFGLAFKSLNSDYWYDVLVNLERLDGAWDNILLNLKSSDVLQVGCNEPTLYKIFRYFVYRHFVNISLEFDTSVALKFCILSCYILNSLMVCKNELSETARMYSSEIEYSDKNIYKIIEAL